MSEYRYEPNVPYTNALDGIEYEVLYKPAERKNKSKTASELRITIAVPTKGEFELVPERWWDRLGKFIGIAQEIQTEDPQFDDRCYIRSDTPAYAAAYLSDPVKRIAFLDLQRLGFPMVALRDGQLSALWPGFDPSQHAKPDLIDEAAARLIILSQNLPPSTPELTHNTTSHIRFIRLLLWLGLGLSIPLFIVGLAYEPFDTSPWIRLTAVLLGISLLVLAIVAAVLLRGASRSHYYWYQLIIGGLLLLPWGSCGAVATVNGVNDPSPETEYKFKVVDKKSYHSRRGGRSYKLICQDSGDLGREHTFSVSSSDYNQAEVGKSYMRVILKSGRLGIAWTYHYELVP
jgi:hypothetical protein